MDKKKLVAGATVAVAALLYVLACLLPQPSFPLFSFRRSLRAVGDAAFRGGPEVRARAGVPAPRRYIEAAREEAARIMAAPDWRDLPYEQKEFRLMELFVLRVADAEYQSLSEARQRQVAGAFLRAFLGGQPGTLVDK